MTTWADVSKGDRVRMRGRVFEVVKAKRRGKRVAIELAGAGGRFASEVKAKAEVDVVAEPLHDERGAQRRWAKPAEVARGPLLAPGDPSLTSPPEPPAGPKWRKPLEGDAEAAVVSELGATLIAEATDTGEGYYVPPVDETTVQAHLVIFHDRRVLPSDEASALAEHDQEHRAAEANATLLPINHWHTERRAKP